MIELPIGSSDPLIIGIGHHRTCYIHPRDTSKCIKVIHNPVKHALNEVKREVGYYHYLARHLKDWRGIPRFYGTVETNLGRGFVYDRIIDFEGSPSLTMDMRYGADSNPNLSVEEVQLIDDLEKYLLDNAIVTMTLKPYNILCHRISPTEVFPVICDNIGTAAFIPIEIFCPWFARRRDKRLIEKMRSELFTH